MTQQDSREYDIIVFGATGFTGRLVAEYLSEHYGADNDVAWAMAGRNRDKLAAVRDSLGQGAADIDLIVADSANADELAALVARTRVICTTVGPYAKYGSELVRACANAGTHYCDLCGEVPWMRRMIDQHADAAAASGARIVHCCGFDSIPSDLGVHFAQREAKQRFGEYFQSIQLLVKAMRGAASGGTVASALNVVEEAIADRAVARIVVKPYSLNPEGEQRGPDEADQRGMGRNDAVDTWTAPFVMATVNSKVVRRSHALKGFPYGREFSYSEATMMGSGPVGMAKAAAMSAGIGGFMLAAAVSPLRKLMNATLLPQPGQGPDADARAAGFFNLVLVGELDDGRAIKTRVRGDRDPGYGSTSKMLAESALCLAKDAAVTVPGGFWTPASALGDALLERLTAHAGLSFEFDV